MIELIVAMDEDFGIGHNNRLPWNLPEDLALFKTTTLHHSIVMGRKTFESIGRVLPKRINYVVTRDKTIGQQHPELIIVSDFENFLEQHRSTQERVFVIGGAAMYAQALPYASQLHISHVFGKHHCDVYFPKLDFSKYRCEERKVYSGFEYARYQQVSA
jgi:dihydrofolate reductase